ncbi:Pleiotropic regulatory protein [Alkalihalobacillus alcalophilus ATCC 27647 = CGMCC 1.3604]|uniref:Pleiotropic regulatory protein n=1 Tax=Alkalihalobacillus alcalophilus ATCC 27647 = CGMCC 1.3604 TaxID=1218173 RepID=A0A094XEX2_ALKAL|nr:DegT/DnrJ/EryC1/StrS family aminotransferase [Alkalihalobacillus alcalophilus]KGA97300.1 Pleiotropic regulatory protein [Alkalihalobacillus alcalophilus ATCC 27647 = CGMCC 1.3604]MED1562524.1 DegT/DnrJ/EryC1/StrS family aminotransferase [Alkalihalobacillus alcalophilus]THG92137.1 Pleiotropic regulatory protein [Alkalihalobacillus alcalophilus ATCC 27647 = CGMCC 1.3604]
MISIIQVDRQFKSLKKEILAAVENVIDSGQYILGVEGKQFEKEVCQYLNIAHAINVGNGTDALVLALRALDVGVGDEVMTTPFTFFATAEAISRVGATPVFVDIDPKTYNIDPTLIEDKVTARTKAIIPVHLFGQACEMDKIKQVATKHHLYIIEDACQAFGVELNGEKVGTIGDIGCYSFFPTKNLSSIGDGGLIVTKDEKIANRVKKLRHHGSEKKYYHDEIGYNSRLDEIHAAILRICLTKIDEWNGLRVEKAKKYSVVEHFNGFSIPTSKGSKTHGYHLYCIEHPKRNEVIHYMESKGIGSGIYYPLPLHLQKVYQKLGYQVGDLPIAEEKAKRLLALPMHPYLTIAEQEAVIEILRAYQ